MGGAIGVQLALNHPEILNGLILMNPGLGSVFSDGFKFKLMAPFLSLMAKNRWLLTIFLKSILTRPVSDEIRHNFLKDAMVVSKETWTEYLHPNNTIQYLDHLSRLEIPTLVMIGGKDRPLFLDMQHRLADSIPKAHKIVFDDEGHGMAVENPGAKIILNISRSLSERSLLSDEVPIKPFSRALASITSRSRPLPSSRISTTTLPAE